MDLGYKDQSNRQESAMQATFVQTVDKPADTRSLKLDSVALSRLVEEVRNGAVSAPTAYNRQHNRHNR
jgi:hypothetical protein